MKSLIIAFSTYSKIPMPQVKWDEKSMRYSMCFFPMVGLTIGVLWYLLYMGMEMWNLPEFFVAAVLTAVPVLLTGGIHVDGFMDTMDAKNSYRSKEEKLQILKDPHIGAFAVISCVVYFLLMFGIQTMVASHVLMGNGVLSKNGLLSIGIFVLERILSGLSVIYFPKAKKDGMLAETAKASEKRVGIWLWIEFILTIAVMIYLHWQMGCLLIAIALGTFWYYRKMSEKIFGGITGDLAGYFLQLAELLLFLGLGFGNKIFL